MNEIVCRICLQTCTEILSIFTKYEDLSPYQMLLKLNLIQITVIGSTFICSQCLTELCNSVKFLEKCEKSNRILLATNTQDEPLQLQNEYLDTCQDTKLFVMKVNNVVDYEENPDLEPQNQGQQIHNPCTECGSKRNCVHKPPTLYTCEYCQKIFTKKFNYTIHVKRHLGLREWPCPACGAPQVSNWLAKRHCARESRFVCPAPNCTRSYTSYHNLTVHYRNHTGDKPHKCAECGKRFTSKTRLNVHIRRHTGVKPYMCSICGAQFATNKLVAHLKTHAKTKTLDRQTKKTDSTGSQPPGMYPCSHCPTRYSHKQSLNRHLRRRHANSQKQDKSNVLSVTTVNNV